jgi:UPF0716 protein FxsA
VPLLFLLFVLLPVLEIWLLVWLGMSIGWLPVLALVILSGLVGARLARHQSFHTWRRISLDLQQGRVPNEALLDGLLVLAASLLLILPGLISDAAALLLLFPPTRRGFKALLRQRFQARSVTMHYYMGPPGAQAHDEIIDVKVLESPPRQLP